MTQVELQRSGPEIVEANMTQYESRCINGLHQNHDDAERE